MVVCDIFMFVKKIVFIVIPMGTEAHWVNPLSIFKQKYVKLFEKYVSKHSVFIIFLRKAFSKSRFHQEWQIILIECSQCLCGKLTVCKTTISRDSSQGALRHIVFVLLHSESRSSHCFWSCYDFYHMLYGLLIWVRQIRRCTEKGFFMFSRRNISCSQFRSH